jgi:hypothetical protein
MKPERMKREHMKRDRIKRVELPGPEIGILAATRTMLDVCCVDFSMR